VFECLSKLDSSTLTSIQFQHVTTPMEFSMTPTVDNFFLPNTPQALVKEEKSHRKDILIGNTLDEGSYFLPYQYPNIFSPHKSPSLTHGVLVGLLQDYFAKYTKAQRNAIVFQVGFIFT